jgi:hypothetical protein
MQIAKPLPQVQRPFNVVNTVMKQLGFKKVKDKDKDVYRTVIHEVNIGQQYELSIPVTSDEAEECVILGQADIKEHGDKRIPAEVRLAAWGKMCDAYDYLKYGMRSDGTRNTEPVNGEMAPGLEEMKRLGKEMESIDTNRQVHAKGAVPDPKQ